SFRFPRPPCSTLFPYTTLFRSLWGSLWEFLPDMVPDDFEQTLIRKPVFQWMGDREHRPTKQDPFRSGRGIRPPEIHKDDMRLIGDRKSTRLNSSHSQISYAVFC